MSSPAFFERSPLLSWQTSASAAEPGPEPSARLGFTIVELLVVLAVMMLMIGILVPALAGMKGAQDVTSTGYEIAGTLERARAYAMANNTYVWVGFSEVDATKDPSAVPQTAGAGRVAVLAVASKDGTRHYAVTTTNQGADWQAAYAQSSSQDLIPISKLQRFDGAHLAATLGAPPGSGGMARPTVSSSYILGDSNCIAATPFTYPLGGATPQYKFGKVIEFNPEGVARIPFKDTGDKIVQWMEIDLQHTYSNIVPPAPAASNTGNNIALQVEGMTGSTRIYRP